MGTETPSGAKTTPEKVYVTIPKASPSQKYHAPKNYQQPLIDAVSKLLIVVLCASIPLATALIFAMILGASEVSRTQFLWLWIPMIVLVEGIGIAVAIGLGREALGATGSHH